MTGADIAAIVNAAAMTAIREHVSNGKDNKKLRIAMKHFEAALDKIKGRSLNSRDGFKARESLT
jgi:SpoVK/Ycf46/Vps4 family AAA+-type ATPase